MINNLEKSRIICFKILKFYKMEQDLNSLQIHLTVQFQAIWQIQFHIIVL